MKSIFKKIISSILIFESKAILRKYNPTIIAVTGSVGKTSTKDAIFSILFKIGHIRKSEKSFNSEFGVPLTIIGCQNGWNNPLIWIRNIFVGLELIILKSNYPQCLILEIGADHPGDIQSIVKWLKTDIVVITKIGEVPVHVEYFTSPQELVKEKSYLIKSLKKDGVLVLSVDDIRVKNLSKDVTQKYITYGIDDIATVMASNLEIVYDQNKLPVGMSFRLNYQANIIPIKIMGVLGKQQIYPLVAASAVGLTFNVSTEDIISSIDSHKAPKGRMHIIAGINGSTLIDDSYNSSPDALSEGLATLASLQASGKRIAVIGDMLELGRFSAEEHKKAGIQAMQSSDILVTVGQRARQMSDKAISFDDSISAAEYVKGIVSLGDIVFIKGSQGMRMERVAKALLLDQDKADELLVRQEPEWLAKK